MKNQMNSSILKKIIPFSYLVYITETGWAITSTCVGMDMPLHPAVGVTGKPVPGWNGKLLTR